jgi:hypothetical protein
MFGKEFEKLLIVMECFAIIGFFSVFSGIAFGIYKLIKFVFWD